ncbi:MAG TPA: IS110 family transposase [Acidobacteriota bacterium]|nr:IS110 family transposase [Acidobacteriota bacterium]
MTTATRESNYTETQSVLYLALELSARRWRLGTAVNLGQRARQVTIPAGDRKALEKELAKAKKRFGLDRGAAVCSCYEAGRDAHWVHRFLQQMQIENLQVNSSSIEVKRQARRAKSDSLDVESLLRLLIRRHMGEHEAFKAVNVPSPQAEDERHLHRHLSDLKREATRLSNRVRGLLATQGACLRGPVGELPEALEGMRSGDGRPLDRFLKARLMGLFNLWEAVQQQIAELASLRRRWLREEASESMSRIKRMMQIKAVGPELSWTLEMEIFSWRRIRNGKQLGSLLGLTPSPYQSGGSSYEQGISKAGNRWVRKIIVEVAWMWVRYQPQSELSRWFERRFAHAGKRARKVGIVAVARKLAILLWRFRETGELPPGVLLKGQAPAAA